MKNKIILIAILLLFTSCNNYDSKNVKDPKKETTVASNDSKSSSEKGKIKVNIKNKKNNNSTSKTKKSTSLNNLKEDKVNNDENYDKEVDQEQIEDNKNNQSQSNYDDEETYPKEADDKMRKFVFDNLRGEELHNTYEDSPQIYSEIGCADDGHFFGYYFGTKAADNYDAGLEEAARQSGLGELHESEFEGDFEVVRWIGEGAFEMKIKNLHITSTPGVDSEMPYKAIVDYQKLVDESHTYILYVHGAYLPMSARKGTDLEERFTPTFEPLKSESQAHEDHAYGPILYDKTADIAWNAWTF